MTNTKHLFVFLLSILLAGCNTIGGVKKDLGLGQGTSEAKPAETPAATPTATPTKPAAGALAPTQAADFNPGVLSPEERAQNLKKCEGWEKLSAAEKKKKEFFCWRNVGADPYQGTPTAALEQSGWPVEVQKLFSEQIRQGVKAEMIIDNGMKFDWQTYGRGVSKAFVHNHVIANWKEGEVHRASVFTVVHGGNVYKLYLPHDCANWSGNKYSVPVSAAPTPIECLPGKRLTYNPWSMKKISVWSPEIASSVRQYAARDGKTGAVTGRDLGDTPAARFGATLRDNAQQLVFPAPMTVQLYEVEIRSGIITPVSKIGGGVNISGPHTWELSSMNLAGRHYGIELPSTAILDGENYKPLWPTSQKGRNFVFVSGNAIDKRRCLNTHGFYEIAM